MHARGNSYDMADMTMTSEAEKESMLASRFSPKHRQGRRLLLVVGVVCFVLLFVIGIVIGYFVGKNAGKCEANRSNSVESHDHLDLAQVYKDAVELVSTNQLRDFLK